MFKLESPYYLLLVFGIPVVLFLLHVLNRRSSVLWRRLGYYYSLVQSYHRGNRYGRLRNVSLLVGFIFLIISLANPQYGLKKQKVKSQTAEIIIALDVSLSMMAEDIKPNRLSRAKLWIKQFTERFPDLRIGLISFAGNAYLQSPVTTDLTSINLLTSISNPNLASTQGTSLSQAIELAAKAFNNKDGFQKMLILLTDGEDHEGEAIEAAQNAAKQGITIVCVPFGSEVGSTIPIVFSNSIDVKRDQNGNPVVTKPNLKLLSEISSASNGIVIDLNLGNEGFKSIGNKIQTIIRKETSFQSFTELESYYQWPLIVVIISLITFIYFQEKEKIQI
ncbi:MAG: VWA domain-containing protein [Saprospiraceae bacterium]|nr:VWA domain-containing protein [Saprospiraceae bacterium]